MPDPVAPYVDLLRRAEATQATTLALHTEMLARHEERLAELARLTRLAFDLLARQAFALEHLARLVERVMQRE